MGMYNDKVLEHFTNPRNVGEIENADATGAFGSPVCGDMTEFFIKVEGDKIVDAKFKTFGCCAAIASSSMATEMMKGKTVEEVLKITNEQIIDELGGLPEPKVHCSLLADNAIKSAIYNYAKSSGKSYAGLEGYVPDEK
jgi:nitrogen fixation NifU-like protein